MWSLVTLVVVALAVGASCQDWGVAISCDDAVQGETPGNSKGKGTGGPSCEVTREELIPLIVKDETGVPPKTCGYYRDTYKILKKGFCHQSEDQIIYHHRCAGGCCASSSGFDGIVAFQSPTPNLQCQCCKPVNPDTSGQTIVCKNYKFTIPSSKFTECGCEDCPASP